VITAKILLNNTTQAAYDASTESVKAFNDRGNSRQSARETFSKNVFSGNMGSESHQKLAAVIDRLTYIGACELFLALKFLWICSHHRRY
jgi:hypothetical protein